MGRSLDITPVDVNPGITDTPGVWGTGKYQVFNASGQWTAPSNVTRVRVTALGAGGGAAGQCNSQPGNSCYCSSIGGSGGGGGYAVGVSCVVGGTSYCVVVGAGGTHCGQSVGLSCNGGPGGAGGGSCFPGICATGGGGGGATSHSCACSQGGAGGCGIGGTVNRCGSAGVGAPGNCNNQSNVGCWGTGTGGSAASPAGNGGSTVFGGNNFDGTSSTVYSLDTLIAKYGLDLPKWCNQVLYSGTPTPGAGGQRLPCNCSSFACAGGIYCAKPGGGGAAGGGGVCNAGCCLGAPPGDGLVIVEY